MLNQCNSVERLVSVCSVHPLAVHMLKDAIDGDNASGIKIKLWTTVRGLHPERNGELLLLDGCSAEDWPELTLRWRQNGGKVLVLLPPENECQIKQLRALFLGVSGVVTSSNNWQNEVRRAVVEVLEGRLWIGRDVLTEYVRRTGPGSRHRRSSGGVRPDLTAREEQIMSFLLRRASNKEIGNAFDISERTVKYHVSNILQKFQVSNRRELLEGIQD